MTNQDKTSGVVTLIQKNNYSEITQSSPKTHVKEPFFSRVAGCRLKLYSITGVFLKNSSILLNICSVEHLQKQLLAEMFFKIGALEDFANLT